MCWCGMSRAGDEVKGIQVDRACHEGPFKTLQPEFDHGQDHQMQVS